MLLREILSGIREKSIADEHVGTETGILRGIGTFEISASRESVARRYGPLLTISDVISLITG